jgi:hypothetical protein
VIPASKYRREGMDVDLEESNVGLGEEGGDERQVEGEEGE